MHGCAVSFVHRFAHLYGIYIITYHINHTYWSCKNADNNNISDNC